MQEFYNTTNLVPGVGERFLDTFNLTILFHDFKKNTVVEPHCIKIINTAIGNQFSGELPLIVLCLHNPNHECTAQISSTATFQVYCRFYKC